VTAPGEVTVCATSLAAARRVRLLRRERGWSQDRLAVEAGLSHCMMSFLENGRRNWTLPMLERVAVALDTTPAGLLGWGCQ
jgi:transcriptional regulator with XRE-family HTH domain